MRHPHLGQQLLIKKKEIEVKYLHGDTCLPDHPVVPDAAAWLCPCSYTNETASTQTVKHRDRNAIGDGMQEGR